MLRVCCGSTPNPAPAVRDGERDAVHRQRLTEALGEVDEFYFTRRSHRPMDPSCRLRLAHHRRKATPSLITDGQGYNTGRLAQEVWIKAEPLATILGAGYSLDIDIKVIFSPATS